MWNTGGTSAGVKPMGVNTAEPVRPYAPGSDAPSPCGVPTAEAYNRLISTLSELRSRLIDHEARLAPVLVGKPAVAEPGHPPYPACTPLIERLNQATELAESCLAVASRLGTDLEL